MLFDSIQKLHRSLLMFVSTEKKKINRSPNLQHQPVVSPLPTMAVWNTRNRYLCAAARHIHMGAKAQNCPILATVSTNPPCLVQWVRYFQELEFTGQGIPPSFSVNYPKTETWQRGKQQITHTAARWGPISRFLPEITLRKIALWKPCIAQRYKCKATCYSPVFQTRRDYIHWNQSGQST